MGRHAWHFFFSYGRSRICGYDTSTFSYVTLEVWGREGGSADACLGACRLLISQDAPSHGSDFSWVSLHRASTLQASIQVCNTSMHISASALTTLYCIHPLTSDSVVAGSVGMESD
jgi:hypothetical protein